MQGGTPRPDSANPIAEWFEDKRGKEVAVTILVFETAVAAHHFWQPRASGYKVLWKKTFTVSVPEPKKDERQTEDSDLSVKKRVLQQLGFSGAKATAEIKRLLLKDALIPYAGKRIVYGFNGAVQGALEN